MKKERFIQILSIFMVAVFVLFLFGINGWNTIFQIEKASKNQSKGSGKERKNNQDREENLEKEGNKNSMDRKKWEHLVKGKNPGYFPENSPTGRYVEILFLKEGKNGKLEGNPLNSFTINNGNWYIASGSPRHFRYRYPLSKTTKEDMLRADTQYSILCYFESEHKEFKIKTPKLSELSPGGVKYFPITVPNEQKKSKQEKEEQLTWEDMKFSSIQITNLPVVESKRYKKRITYYISQKVVEVQVSPEAEEAEVDLTSLSPQRIKKVDGGVITVSFFEVDDQKRIFQKTLAYRKEVSTQKITLSNKDKINWSESPQKKIDLTEYGITSDDHIRSVSIGKRNNEVVENPILPGAFPIFTCLNFTQQDGYTPSLKAPKGDNYVIWVRKAEEVSETGHSGERKRLETKTQVLSENVHWPLEHK